MSRILAACFALLLATSANADEIVLKNGGRFHGRILRENDQSITLQLSYGNMTFSRSEIQEVLRDRPEDRIRDELMRRLERRQYRFAIRSAGELAALAPDERRSHDLARWLVLIAGRQLDDWKLAGATETLVLARKGAPATPGLSTAEARLRELEAQAKGRLLEARLRLHRNSAAFDPPRVEAALVSLLEIDTELRAEVRRTYALALAFRASGMLPDDGEAAVPLLEHSLEIAPDVGEGVVQAYILARAIAAYRTFERGEVASAEEHVSAALSIDPASRVAHFVRGQLRHARGEIRMAVDDYMKALGRDDGRVVATTEIAERLRAECMAWVRENYRLKDVLGSGLDSIYTDDAPMHEATVEDILVSTPDPELSRLLAEQIREQRLQLVEVLGLPAAITAFDVPLRVVVHPTESSFRSAVARPGEFAALTVFASDAAGMLDSHTIHTYADVPDLRTSVIPHELAHVLVAATVGYQVTLPLWLHEGLAITAEPVYQRSARLKQVASAASAGDLIPVDQIIGSRGYPSSTYDNQLFYAQSFTLVSYLRTRLPGRRFWDYARMMGTDIDAALGRVLEEGETVDDLELGWLVWLGVLER